ncbi:hypothetical protein TNIN_336221 [Trichonephila inaurata madagascariensis]|uniref:Uncharacterized protein n=1 Tax=Trichonephila inaurata madagascariensis TaxID=2747483 RepID=A0A8X6YKY6_9ARAC|nr:hypothetical protein TNIN_336221 [Trichonephila inaurata madagascariensis]
MSATDYFQSEKRTIQKNNKRRSNEIFTGGQMEASCQKKMAGKCKAGEKNRVMFFVVLESVQVELRLRLASVKNRMLF